MTTAHAAATCGLFTAAQKPVPLDGVRVDARLEGPCVALEVVQRYTNREAVPIEAVYVFPLDAEAAVCGFRVTTGDRVIEGRVDEREAAFATYDDALADGHGAYLMDQERPDVFTVSVGNLAPGQTVEIAISTVSLAADEGDALRLTIPTTVSPRYVPASAPQLGQSDGERVNPEHRPSVPYGLTLSVEVDAGGPLKCIESPSHTVRTALREDGATVTLTQAHAALDRDFVLLVETQAARQPQALVAREADGTRVCMVTFAPDLSAEAAGRELQFVIDCSGSMGGDSIDQARRALELCVRALEPDDRFNVTRFGSSFQTLWPSARAYDQAAQDAAIAWIRDTHANMGGTEILAPMNAILSAPVDEERPRQVLLLTDGEVSNEAEVIALAEAHAGHARVFSFGIGAGASRHLVTGIARASRGASEFIFPGERIEPKVLRMFGRVRSPALRDIAVDWAGLEVEAAPRQVPPIFAGDRLTLFGRVRGGAADAVTLVAGDRRWSVPLDLERATEGGPVPTLWARERVRDLEDGSGRRGSSQRRAGREEADLASLVALGKRYGLVSSATSYVAIETRVGDAKTTEQAQLRRVPVALTAGWGGAHGILPPPSAAGGFVAGRPVPQTSYADKTGYIPVSAPPAPVMASREAPAKRRSRGGLGALAKGISNRFSSRAKSLREEPLGELFDASPLAPMTPQEDGSSSVDRLYAVLMTQRADGSFPLSPALETWLGDALSAVEAAVASHPAQVVATSVVIALLERDERGREPEWRAAAAKARRWLASQSGSCDGAALIAAA